MNDVAAIFLCLLLIVLGISTVLFLPRFNSWLNKVSLPILKVLEWYRFDSSKSDDVLLRELTNCWFNKFVSLMTRILGGLIAVIATVALIGLLIRLLK